MSISTRLAAALGALGLAVAGVGAVAAPQAVAAPGGIVINEIESSGGSPDDWIELRNTSAEPIDISGFIVSDSDDTHRWPVPAGTVVPAGAYYVVDIATVAGGFGLGASDAARIFAADGTTLIDSYAWAGGHAPTSLGRCPDGTGEFSVTGEPTKGTANSCLAATGRIVINEIESQAGSPDDWVELLNVGDAPIDLSGYVLTDNAPSDPTHRHTIPAGTVVNPGEYLVIDVGGDVFGLGGADSVNLFGTDGVTVVDTYSWTAHSATTYGRCPDGTGDFADTSEPTKGAANLCPDVALAQVVINEVNSNTGTDFIEIYNIGGEPADISGYLLKDNMDTRTDAIPAGTVLQPGGFYVAYDGNGITFGLGKDDAARLFTPDGVYLVDHVSWADHMIPSWGRCPDGGPQFQVTRAATPGAPNDCGEPAQLTPWPGSADTTVLDTTSMFLGDSSGLDFAMEGEQGVLWAIDNGTGTLWKLDAAADGSVTVAEGWADGKRVRFIKDADDAGAAGPDAEGVTAAGDGFVYVAAERDNSDKGVNFNTILKVDPNGTGTDLVAVQEWDLTSSLPQVSANTGVEAVEWVSDDALAGQLWDANHGAPYDPASYPLHGDGLFFVAVEDNGGVYAYVLNSDGTAVQVAFIDPKLGGVMALDWDKELGLLWALCDDGCSGDGAQITLNGTDSPVVEHVARPANLPNTNNEGFATSTLCMEGERPVWWFTDGLEVGALRSGTLPCDEPVVEPSPEPSPSPSPEPTDEPTVAPSPEPSGRPSPTPAPPAGDDNGTGPRPGRPGLPSTGV